MRPGDRVYVRDYGWHKQDLGRATVLDPVCPCTGYAQVRLDGSTRDREKVVLVLPGEVFPIADPACLLYVE